jgi:hypothetical protein
MADGWSAGRERAGGGSSAWYVLDINLSARTAHTRHSQLDMLSDFLRLSRKTKRSLHGCAPHLNATERGGGEGGVRWGAIEAPCPRLIAAPPTSHCGGGPVWAEACGEVWSG